nr:DegT/DnrJ/EryC1/StrS family aminotransferase [Gemmatimonadota bacterium]
MHNPGTVAGFEEAFADFVGARFAVSFANGTATLHSALAAVGVRPGDTVSVPCITMASTTIAVLHAGAIPEFVDVDPETWLMQRSAADYAIPVSLFGLCPPYAYSSHSIDDAAQTLRKHGPSAFTSYSFQASKIISTGEG